MDKTAVAVTLLISGSFALGFLTAWYYLSSKISKHRYVLRMMTNILAFYKEHLAELEVPKAAQIHMKAANKSHSEMKELLAQIEQPNKNASHALYKNDLRDRLMNLNVERLEHLQRAVDSGYNPMIQFNGEPTKMSEVIAAQLKQAMSVMDGTKPRVQPKPKQEPTKAKVKPEPTKLAKPRHLSVIKD